MHDPSERGHCRRSKWAEHFPIKYEWLRFPKIANGFVSQNCREVRLAKMAGKSAETQFIF
jgi:hypothetical protein